jgi:hypothetical protein
VKVNYILAMYFGERRSYDRTQDRLEFLRTQLTFLENIPPDSAICHVVFSINESDDIPREEIERLIREASLPIEYLIRYRPNIGYSYANWNEVMIELRDRDFDYHFLMEDDYVPTSPYFYQPFIDLTTEKIPFVCLKASENGFMGHQRHPTICVGLIRCKEAIETLNRVGSILWIHPGQDYRSAEESQIHMMDNFNRIGYDFTGIPDNVRKPFWDNSLGLWERGGIDPPIIIPIGVSI